MSNRPAWPDIAPCIKHFPADPPLGMPPYEEPDRNYWLWYFAGQALAGIMARPLDDGIAPEEAAEEALDAAGALLEHIESV